MMRSPLRLSAAFCLALAVWHPARSSEFSEFKAISLQQILGPRWSEFERSYGVLHQDPHNEQAFQDLSSVLSESGAVNKVAPYLETLLGQADDRALRLILGSIYKDLLRDPSQATLHFEKVLKEDPNEFFAHYQLALIAARQSGKRLDEAIDHYRRAAAAITRQNIDLQTRIYKELGELYFNNREGHAAFESLAISVWDNMVAGDRKFDLQTYDELAGEYSERNMWSKVVETYQRYFSVLKELNDKPDNPTQTRLLAQIGDAYEQQRDYQSAITSYAEALKLLDPDHWQRRKLEQRILECHRNLKTTAGYQKQLKTAADETGDRVPALKAYARMLWSNGQVDDAAATLEQARTLSPHDVPTLNMLAEFYRQMKKPEDLAKVLRSKIDLSPESFNAYTELADAYLQQKNSSQAESVLKELEQGKGDAVDKYLLLARAYREYKLLKPAFAAYSKLLESGRAAPADRVEFCDFCLDSADYAAQAEAEAGRLAGEGALNAEGFVQLARIFRAHGRADFAVNLLNTGLERCTAGKPDPQAVFVLNLELSDLHHSLGAGHHALAIGCTLKAILNAPTFYFKRSLNDRLVTLLTNYGHRAKVVYTAEEEKSGDPRQFGGPHGQGVAPWVDFLNVQANGGSQADFWLLLGQLNETCEVDAAIPLTDAKSPPRRVTTSMALARQCYQKVIDMDFQNIDAHVSMARVLSDPIIDEYEKAVEELTALGGLLNPIEKWDYLRAAGDLLADAGETKAAREDWTKVADEAASEPNLLYQLAMRLFRGGELARAAELLRAACDIAPAGFNYRVAFGNLLARASQATGSTEQYTETLNEFSTALTLAQASPELAAYVDSLQRDVVQAHIELARASFLKGDWQAAEKEYKAVESTLSTDEKSTNSPLLLDAKVQVVRCAEAAGEAPDALKRYAQTLQDRPEFECWISNGVTVPSRTFLALKQAGRLNEQWFKAENAASEAVNRAAAPGAVIELHSTVRDARLMPNGRLVVITDDVIHQVDPAQQKKIATSPNADPGTMRAVMSAAGADRTVSIAGMTICARDLMGGKIWSVDAEPQTEKRWRSIGLSARLALLGAGNEIQVHAAADGRLLWTKVITADSSALSDSAVVLISGSKSGAKELVILDAETGRSARTQALPPSVVFLRPVIAGDCVLLTNAVNGSITAYDLRDGRRRLTCTLNVTPVAEPQIAGRLAILHYLRANAMWAVAVDLQQLKVRFNVPIEDKGARQKDQTTPPPADKNAATADRSGHSGIDIANFPPLVWRDAILYFNSKDDSVFALDCMTGNTSQISAAQDGKPMACIRWLIHDDILILVGAEGEIRFILLSVL